VVEQAWAAALPAGYGDSSAHGKHPHWHDRLLVHPPTRPPACCCRFTPGAWLVFASVCLSYGLLVWLIDGCSPFGAAKTGATPAAKRELAFPVAFFRTLLSFNSKSLDNPAAWASRVLTVAFYFFLLYSSSAYSAGLNAQAVASSLKKSVNTFKDIQANELTFGVLDRSSEQDYFKKNPSFAVRVSGGHIMIVMRALQEEPYHCGAGEWWWSPW